MLFVTLVVTHFSRDIKLFLYFAMELKTTLCIILCFALNYADTQFVDGPKPAMSKEQAAYHCNKTGSNLLNYKQIKTNPSAQEYLSQLNNGESAWIEGYAKLSPFLSWQGCYNTSESPLSIRTVAIGYESVNRCIGICQTYQYIGLKNRSCYCIDDVQRHAIGYYAVNDSFCSAPCPNNAVDSCGGFSYTAVYSILEDRIIHWAANEPSSHLCVYVKRKDNNFAVYTASCHTIPFIIDGYICANSVWSRLITENCSIITPSRMYCIQKDIHGSSRQDASKGCYRRKGTLADLGAEMSTSVYLESNFKYWIGIHRTFGIAEMYKENETVCLAATKVGDQLVIEPDDCTAQKFYLCESQSDVNTTTVPNSTTELVTEGRAETPIEYIYIIPGVLVVIAIILVILFTAYMYRRNKRSRNGTMPPTVHTYNAKYETGAMKKEYELASDECSL